MEEMLTKDEYIKHLEKVIQELKQENKALNEKIVEDQDTIAALSLDIEDLEDEIEDLNNRLNEE